MAELRAILRKRLMTLHRMAPKTPKGGSQEVCFMLDFKRFLLGQRRGGNLVCMKEVRSAPTVMLTDA